MVVISKKAMKLLVAFVRRGFAKFADADSKICHVCTFDSEQSALLSGGVESTVDDDEDDEYDDDDYDDEYDDDDYDDDDDDYWSSSKCSNCGVNHNFDATECHVCGLLLGGAPSGTTGVFGEDDFDHN